MKKTIWIIGVLLSITLVSGNTQLCNSIWESNEDEVYIKEPYPNKVRANDYVVFGIPGRIDFLTGALFLDNLGDLTLQSSHFLILDASNSVDVYTEEFRWNGNTVATVDKIRDLENRIDLLEKKLKID